MDPQQSIQPDPPDDDPDQDPDQPPPYPSPALLDSALSLVAQPLASAAARVAASHPTAFPLEDLNDFNVDLSWAAPEIDSAFLNDTEYLQLGDDLQPSPPPHPSLNPQPLPSVTTIATAAIPHSIPHSQPLRPPVSLSAQTFPSVPTPQNEPPPVPRPRSSSLARKPSRHRLPQPNVKHNPIPIAPRSLPNTNLVLDRSSASPAPRSMQAQSSIQDAQNPISTPLRQTPDPAPAPVSAPTPTPTPAPAPAPAPTPTPAPTSHETQPSQTPPTSLTRFPLGMSPHPMIPIMNMYPLQHHQSIFHPSQSGHSPHGLNNADATLTPRPPATDSTKLPTITAKSTSAPSSHPAQPQNPAHQPFLSPPIQVMPQSMVPYDTNILPFFQMAYAAAAAGYPHGVVPPLPTRSPGMPPPMTNPYTSDRSTGVNHDNDQNNTANLPDAASMEQVTQQPGLINVKSAGGPVVVQKAGKQVFVPQQKAARLERHPVLGRLQLKSPSKPQVATSSGFESSSYVAETNMSATESHQTGSAGPSQMGTSSSNAGPSSVAASKAAQRQQKKRLVWTQELHDRFVKAISAVGLNNAVPKTIVTIMNVEGLTTEHVKSHLQKYRNSMRKEAAEEERDRGSGAGSSHKFGAPSAGAAPGIHTAILATPPGNGKRSSQVRAVATDQVRHQALSFLPRRMKALGDQMKEILQPRGNTELSKGPPGSVPNPNPNPATKDKTKMSPSPSPKLPSTEGRVCAEVRSPDQIPLTTTKQVNASVIETHNLKRSDSMKVSAGESASKSAITDGNATTSEKLDANENVSNRCTAQPGNDRSGAEGVHTDAVIGGAEYAQRSATFKQTTTAAADIRPLQNEFSGIKQQDDAKQTSNSAITKANEKVEEARSASQSNRDLELELMKEETQQMQLQVQMMVFRTIALEKKFEEIHSGHLNAEVSGRVDSSRRSTGGDAVPEVDRARRNKTQGGELCKSEGGGSEKRTENATSKEKNERNAEEDNQKQFEIRTKKRPYAGEGQTEVEALLGEQLGLQKRLKNASALIDKRMKVDGDQVYAEQNTGGQVWDNASVVQSKKEDDDGKKDRSLVDPKSTPDQRRNG